MHPTSLSHQPLVSGLTLFMPGWLSFLSASWGVWTGTDRQLRNTWETHGGFLRFLEDAQALGRNVPYSNAGLSELKWEKSGSSRKDQVDQGKQEEPHFIYICPLPSTHYYKCQSTLNYPHGDYPCQNCLLLIFNPQMNFSCCPGCPFLPAMNICLESQANIDNNMHGI